jgi:DNA-binding CsgD family transcriptional regulator
MIALSRSQRRTDHVFKSLLEQRSRPYVVIFDGDAGVAFAEPRALALLETRFPSLQNSLCEIIHRWRERDADAEQLIGPLCGLILRIVPLSGPLGHFYAIFFEQEARREDLTQAVTRFSFTPREVEVLDRILNGMNAAEIAEDLCIAEVTVFDHFKHISHKTKARNRADMLAKVFNWQPDLKSKGRGTRQLDRRASHA